MVRTLLLSTVLAVAACGGKPPVTSSVASEPSAPAAAGDENLPPAVAKLQDKLTPLWQAQPGPDRTRDACASAAELAVLADDVDKGGAPVGVDAVAWSAEVAELRTALAAMEQDCSATQGANLPTTFEAVHHEYNEIVELTAADGAAPADPHAGEPQDR